MDSTHQVVKGPSAVSILYKLKTAVSSWFDQRSVLNNHLLITHILQIIFSG